MKIRFYNARILTMEVDRDIFFGEVWVVDDKIAYISVDGQVDQEWKASLFFDREIDCKGNLLMPGFKNAHTHSAMTFLRSYADDVPLEQWLQQKVFPMEAKLKEEDIYTFAKLAVLEYLSSGVTAIFDMYLRSEAVAKACSELGMRCVLVCGLNNFTSSLEQMEREYLNLNTYHPLIRYQLGFHAEYTTSKELLMGVADLAKKYKAPVYCHLSETEKEVQDCVKRYGMTPTVFLDSLGIFDYGGGGYHCIYMSEEDMQIFQQKGLHVVTNPASNLKLASGIAPIAEFLKRGISVSIGTDGPASNNCLDMFREMFLVSGLNKIREKDAAGVDAGEILRMATVQGSYAMGLPDTDVLAVGKAADMILLDLQQPNMQPIHNISKNIVFSGSKSNVQMTMIRGKILYEGGEYYVGESKEEIYQQCSEILQRMFSDECQTSYISLKNT